jgi:uncharacterized OB-fold protein
MKQGDYLMSKERYPLLTISSEIEQPYNYSLGRYGGRLLKELKHNKKIVGIKCPKCGHVYVPPRQVCGKCFVKMDEFAEISNKGNLESFTVVYFSFLDPETGQKRPVPYGYGRIKLDGADSGFLHFLEESDLKKLKIGMRVEAVFDENRTGSFKDIKYFKITKERNPS